MVMLQPRSHAWEPLHHLRGHVLGLHGTLLKGWMRNKAVRCAWSVEDIVLKAWLALRRMSEHGSEKHPSLMTMG